MEIEYVACCMVSSQAIWIHNFITNLKIMSSIERSINMYCDNEVVVKFSNNNKSSSVYKHMEVKFLIVKKRIRDHLVTIKHIGIDSILVDPLIGVLSSGTYIEHILKISLVSSFEVCFDSLDGDVLCNITFIL